MIARCLFAAAIASAAAVAEAAPPQAAEAAASQSEIAAQPEEERKVCRTSRVTGSLTRRNRVCLTLAQWREVEIRSQQGVNDFNRSASGSSVDQDAGMTYGPPGIDQYSGQPNTP